MAFLVSPSQPGAVSLQTSSCLLIALLLLLAYLVYIPLYNVFLHPLRKFPGPKWWAASSIPNLCMILDGKPHKKVLQLHNTYGDIVRIGPNELSFIAPDAWRDIMGHRKAGQSENGKDPYYANPAIPHVISAGREDHSRMRRALAHGFSAQSMLDQQPLIMGYVDLLMRRLREKSAPGSPSGQPTAVDMMSWYNYCTFDIIGDLAFGQPFDCLLHADYHPWVSLIFRSVKFTAYGQAIGRVIHVYRTSKAMLLLVPPSIRRSIMAHRRLTKEKVAQRLALNTTRPDFIEAMITPNKNGDALTLKEIEGNAQLLIVAGSETTATLLSGATFLLATHPHVLAKLRDELWSSFSAEKDIDLVNTAKLTYMNAVLNESLRMYPPVPAALPRVTPPEGDTILGEAIPGNTILGIWQYAAYHSEKNFVAPFEFAPERWLGDPRFAADRKDAMQPFSFGPRNCIGMNLAYAEMRLILARVVWNYNLQLADTTRDWIDQNVYVFYEKPPLDVYLVPWDKSEHGRAGQGV